MAASEPEQTFKVTDRRGRVDDAAAQPAAAPVSDEVPPSGAPEPSLVGLFMMLASSALIALGEAPDPATGERHDDLASAADVIEVLTLLRARTEGRRLAEETQVLEEVIYDLQLRYVNATRRSG